MKFIFTIILFSFLSLAQDYPLKLAEAINKGNTAMNEALATYEVHFPDKALWADAIAWAKEAQRIAPDDAESLKLSGQVYAHVNWYGLGYQAWFRYLSLGNILDKQDLVYYKKVAAKQAYAKYVQEDPSEALRIYEEMILLADFDKNAYLWAARISYEQNQINKSLSYSEAILSIEDDESAKYLFNLAETQEKLFLEIDEIYRAGIELYQNGEVYAAKLKFLKVIALDSNMDRAWAALAKASYEQENYRDAFTFYQKASSLKPENGEYTRLAAEAKNLIR